MSTELAVHSTTDLTTAPGQTFFSDKQIAALRQLGVEGASNGDLAVFFHVASRTGLDPFARQIYMISRKTKKGVVQTIQTGIDGYRLTARRAADKHGETLEYEDKLWCGADGVWKEVWLEKTHPWAAKVVVLRAGRRYPAIAHWNEYVQTNFEGNPNQFWAGKPAGQLAKCAEALALRMAFPMELSGVYTDEEMGRAEPVVEARPAGQRPGAKLRASVGLPSGPSRDQGQPVADPGTQVDPPTTETVDAELVSDEPETGKPAHRAAVRLAAAAHAETVQGKGLQGVEGPAPVHRGHARPGTGHHPVVGGPHRGAGEQGHIGAAGPG